MKNLIILFLLISFTTRAQHDELAKLKELNATFIHNFVTNDTASHNKIIHKDFVYISSSGRVVPRDEYMKNWAHGYDAKVYKYWDYRDEAIRIFGNTALVRSLDKYTVVENGKDITGMTIYTDTYIKENGEWKCVQAQITNVDPKYYRGDDKILRKY
jgi:hypothetical protein